MRKSFRNCTIISVAYRLSTIVDFERVVLDEGRVERDRDLIISSRSFINYDRQLNRGEARFSSLM